MVMKNKKKIRGAALVEMALVIGLLVVLLLGIMQFALIFFVHHHMLHAAREATRSLAVRTVTPDEAEVVALYHLGGLSLPFTVTITEPSLADPFDKVVAVEITVPMKQVALGDLLGLIGNENLVARVTMRKEG